MSDKPKRIQRKRTKGWRMPEGAVYVGRPTKWGNPFTPSKLSGDVYGCVKAFRDYMTGHIWSLGLPPDVAELRGKDLACWCPLNQPCHADVLLELANCGVGGERR